MNRDAWSEVPRQYLLRVTAGPDLGSAFLLERKRLVVGRSKTADIRLSELAAAPRYFALVWDPDIASYTVEVWAHPHTIRLNGAALREGARNALKEGDELQLGDTALRYERMMAISGEFKH